MKLKKSDKSWEVIQLLLRFYQRDNSWTQGWYWKDSKGNRLKLPEKFQSCCIMGGLIAFSKDAEVYYNTMKYVEGQLRPFYKKANESFPILMKFNDNPKITKKEVVSVLTKSMKMAKLNERMKSKPKSSNRKRHA